MKGLGQVKTREGLGDIKTNELGGAFDDKLTEIDLIREQGDKRIE